MAVHENLVGRDVKITSGDDAGEVRTIRGVQHNGHSPTLYDVSPWGSPAGSHWVAYNMLRVLDAYVPTTSEIETTWKSAGLKPEYFERWLKAERKRIWDECLETTSDTGPGVVDTLKRYNPYAEE